MRDARSPWSWSGNSYRGHMAWKTAAAGKTASNSPSVRMNFHVLLVLMSPRTMLRRFVLCFSVCVQERTFYFSVEKKSFQAKHVWFMLPRTWICLDLGFNKTNCKACRKAARFCAYRTFFCVSVRWKIHFDLSCCVELSISIFVWHPLCSRYSSTWRSCSLRSASFTLPPTHFSWFPTGPSYYLSPPLPPLLPSTSFSHHPLSLSLQSPTSSWTQLLVSCSWLIIPHGNIFSVDVRELLLLLMKILNIAAPAQPHQKKKNVDGGGGKSRKSAFSPLIQILPRLMKVL